MESKLLNSIRDHLQKEQTQLQAKREEIHAAIQAVDDDIVRIESILAALDGTLVLPASGLTATAKERKKVAGRAPSKADVMKIIHNVRREHGVIDEVSLKALVEAELTKAGFNRMGFKLRFQEALADSQCEQPPVVIHTTGTTSSRGSSSSVTNENTTSTNGVTRSSNSGLNSSN